MTVIRDFIRWGKTPASTGGEYNKYFPSGNKSFSVHKIYGRGRLYAGQRF